MNSKQPFATAFILYTAVLVLVACSNTPISVAPQPVSAQSTELITSTSHPGAQSVSGRLNINISTFGLGIPDDAFVRYQQAVSEPLREAESRYLPLILKHALDESGFWGAVRVVPNASIQSELRIDATIVKSTGQVLELDVTATDSTGQVWLDQRYHDRTSEADYPEPATNPTEPFADLYHQIANDLLTARDQLSEKQLRSISEIDSLRYAQILAPEAFEDYLGTDSLGLVTLNRLPSRDDPIVARINRIRDSEYRYIDTLDQHYGLLGERMQETYFLLRKYQHDYTLEKQRQDHEARTEKRRARGGLAELNEIYGSYQESKYSQAAIAELTETFNSEFEPDVMQVADRVIYLSGSIEDRYFEWRQLMRDIWSAETGLPQTTP